MPEEYTPRAGGRFPDDLLLRRRMEEPVIAPPAAPVVPTPPPAPREAPALGEKLPPSVSYPGVPVTNDSVLKVVSYGLHQATEGTLVITTTALDPTGDIVPTETEMPLKEGLPSSIEIPMRESDLISVVVSLQDLTIRGEDANARVIVALVRISTKGPMVLLIDDVISRDRMLSWPPAVGSERGIGGEWARIRVEGYYSNQEIIRHQTNRGFILEALFAEVAHNNPSPQDLPVRVVQTDGVQYDIAKAKGITPNTYTYVSFLRHKTAEEHTGGRRIVELPDIRRPLSEVRIGKGPDGPTWDPFIIWAWVRLI